MPIVLLAVYMLFINAQAITTGSLIVWLLVLYLGVSTLLLSHTAWAATLVSSYHERSRVFGVIGAAGVVGALAIFLSPVLLERLGPGWLSATVLFLLVDARSFTLSQANILLAISISRGFFGAIMLSGLAMRWSKHYALMITVFGYTLTLAGMLIVPKGAMALMCLNMGIMGFFNGAFAALLRAMTADVSDELRLEQGQERAGLLYAMIVLTTKAAGAFSIFLTFTVLDMIGYNAAAGPNNTPGALHGLELASIAGPIGFVLLGGLCLIDYNLTAQRHDQIRRELEARDAALAHPSGPPAPAAAAPARPGASG